MEKEGILRALAELPLQAQRQVADYIAFLQARHRRSSTPKKSVEASLSKEPFVGIWRDRADMEDSSAWVRSVRAGEWVSSRA